MAEIFLDASYAIALASPRDQHHERAIQLAERIEAERIRLVTTQAVLLEIGNSLAKRRFRAEACTLIAALVSDPAVEVIPLSEPLFRRAFDLFSRYQDKEWGLTDCLSFLVMRERGVTDALTADEHFRAGRFSSAVEGICLGSLGPLAFYPPPS